VVSFGGWIFGGYVVHCGRLVVGVVFWFCSVHGHKNKMGQKYMKLQQK